MKKINDNVFNPALMFGIGLFPLLIICTNLKYAVIFGVLILLALIVSNLLYYAFKPIILESVRIPIYAMIIFGSIYFIDSMISELLPNDYGKIHSMIVYLFVTVIIIYMFESNKKEESFKVGFKNSLFLGIDYLVSLALVGVIREMLAFGKVWGQEIVIGYDGLEFFTTILGGLLVVTIYAIVYNVVAYYIRKHQKIKEVLATRYELYLNQNVKYEPVEENNVTEEEK